MSENGPVTTIEDEDFEEFLEANDRVVLDLWATWCSPCIQMNPLIEELADKYNGEVKFGKVNIENNNQIPSKFGVQSLPSFLFFKNGEIVGKERGAMNKEEFEEKLKDLFDL